MAGQFVKGDERINRKGRPRQEVLSELRTGLDEFLLNNLKDLQTYFDSLTARERANFLLQVYKLRVPAPVNSMLDFSEIEITAFLDAFQEQNSELKKRWTAQKDVKSM